MKRTIMAFVAIFLFVNTGCKVDLEGTRVVKPPEPTYKVRILDLLCQSNGAIVSFEYLADGKRSSIKLYDGAAFPKVGELWEIKLEPICRASYVFVGRVCETSTEKDK